MHFSDYIKALSPTAKTKAELAASQNNLALVASILVQEGQIESAIRLCIDSENFAEAIDVAISTKNYDIAEKICIKLNNFNKLAEILLIKGENLKAAEILVKLQNYERAAKLYFNAKEYDIAAELYVKIDQFMNAIMCYQKSGNTPKQLEMQIKAFEFDLAMANGDLQAVNVSRMMAIYAAKMYLENPDTIELGLKTLKQAGAIDDNMISELFSAGKYLQAGYCLEYVNKPKEALEAYKQANAFDPAYKLVQSKNDFDLEVEILKYFKKYYLLAQKLSTPSHYDEAISALKHIGSDDSDYINALELEGDIYCKQKNYKDAALCYESLFWMKLPNDRFCRVAFKAGYCYEAVDDLQNALKTYQKVYDVNNQFHGISEVIDNVALKLRTQSKPTAMPSTSTNSKRTKTDGAILRNPNRKRTMSVMIGDTEVPTVNSSRYKIIEEVAHGGMGVVYKATDTILQRTVALKVLSQKLKDNQVALEYFMREARASARLQHINIVTVYDIGSLEDGNVYMAMEYVEGKNLKQIVQQTGIFPTKFLIQVATHACRGLQYAHSNGIVHRDIKSSNMMIAKRDKTLKILDMGLAKVLKENERGSTQAIGTPYYMSPEQVLGNEIDARSDIYSLGVTLFELATGVLPFIKGDLPYKHVHEPPPLPSSINPKINPHLEDIILKMMQKDPKDRFASCNDVITELKMLLPQMAND